MSGLTDTGFDIPTIQEIQDEISSLVKARISTAIDTTQYSLMGQLIGIFAEREYLLWVGARDVYNSFTASGATGQSLTNLAELTGVVRLSATKSRVTATVSLTAGTTLPAGSEARVPGSATSFVTLADVTNGTASPANIDVVMEAVETGPVRANAGTLTEIVVPVSGWTAVTNALDADIGRSDETDTELRVRREEEIRISGASNIDAIQAHVSAVEGVISAKGTEDLVSNTFNIVVWDGSPPAADDDAIAQAIWDSKPAGIASTGSETGTALDANSTAQVMNFDRAIQMEVWLTIDVVTDPSIFPVDGADQIKEASATHGNDTHTVGDDVFMTTLFGPVYGIAGVVNVTSILLDFTPSPAVPFDLPIAINEIARFDTSRIVVNVT